MTNHPLVAAIVTTVVVVVLTVTAVVYPWSRVAATVHRESITAEVPAGHVTSTDAGLHYVALGSSYASGPDTAGLISIRCLRTADDYPHQVAAAWGLTLTDVTCSGSTIPDILDRAQRNRAQAPQIDAVTADTDLVTITTGGNDIGYIGRLTGLSCANWIAQQLDDEDHHCTVGRPRRLPTAADFLALRRQLERLVRTVRERAPHAKVIIVDYPPVLDAHGTTCATTPLSPPEAAATVETFNGLTAATRLAAFATNSILVDAALAGADHTVCSASPWIYGYRMAAPYHPNAAGRQAMAQLTLDAMENSGLERPTTPR